MEKKENAMLVTDMPKSCNDCQFKHYIEGYLMCRFKDVRVDGTLSQQAQMSTKRHPNCPLQTYENIACGEAFELFETLGELKVNFSNYLNDDIGTTTFKGLLKHSYHYKQTKQAFLAQAKEIGELRNKANRYARLSEIVTISGLKALLPEQREEYLKLHKELVF